jgi:hypothetical protein
MSWLISLELILTLSGSGLSGLGGRLRSVPREEKKSTPPVDVRWLEVDSP